MACRKRTVASSSQPVELAVGAADMHGSAPLSDVPAAEHFPSAFTGAPFNSSKEGAVVDPRSEPSQSRAANAVSVTRQSTSIDELLQILREYEQRGYVAHGASDATAAEMTDALACIEAAKHLDKKKKAAARKALRQQALRVVQAAEDVLQRSAFEEELPPLAPQPVSQPPLQTEASSAASLAPAAASPVAPLPPPAPAPPATLAPDSTLPMPAPLAPQLPPQVERRQPPPQTEASSAASLAPAAASPVAPLPPPAPAPPATLAPDSPLPMPAPLAPQLAPQVERRRDQRDGMYYTYDEFIAYYDARVQDIVDFGERAWRAARDTSTDLLPQDDPHTTQPAWLAEIPDRPDRRMDTDGAMYSFKEFLAYHGPVVGRVRWSKHRDTSMVLAAEEPQCAMEPWQMRNYIRNLYPWEQCVAMEESMADDRRAQRALDVEQQAWDDENQYDRAACEDAQRAAAQTEAKFQNMLHGVNNIWFWRLAVEHGFAEELLEQQEEHLEQPSPQRARKRPLMEYDSD
jgi:hypothetical protein